VDQLATVLVPGLLGSPRLYAEQLPALWRLGPVTVASHHHADHVTTLARSILAAAPSRFALVGLSMGGYLAFEVMRQAPHRVARLALLDTTARADSPERVQSRHGHMELARAGRFREVVDTLYDTWVHPARATDRELRRLVRQMADDTGVEGFCRQQEAIMTRPDSRPDLSAIRCPTLVVVGEQDTVTTLDHAKEIADAVPDAQLTVVPESGHLSTVEQPEAVTRALVDWLAR
jgi:pimeloyl-ACP methyl ester carboxylesterase